MYWLLGNKDQLWRRQNNRIISAKFGNTFKKDRPLVLTMDSNGNAFVKTPNIEEFQEWILEEKEGIKNPDPGNIYLNV